MLLLEKCDPRSPARVSPAAGGAQPLTQPREAAVAGRDGGDGGNRGDISMLAFAACQIGLCFLM